jgi:hypothetical protein
MKNKKLSKTVSLLDDTWNKIAGISKKEKRNRSNIIEVAIQEYIYSSANNEHGKKSNDIIQNNYVTTFPPIVTALHCDIHFGISKSHVQRLQDAGIIKPKFLGGKRFFLTEDILNALSDECIPLNGKDNNKKEAV